MIGIKKERESDCILKNEIKKFKENLENAEKFKDYLKKKLNLDEDITTVTIKLIRKLNEKIPVLKLIPTKDRGFINYYEYLKDLKTADYKTKKEEEMIVEKKYNFDFPHLSKTADEETTKVNEKIAKDEQNLYVPFLLALTENRVDFVNLFLENGLHIKKFLTVEKLKKLYFNTEVFKFYFFIFYYKNFKF